MRRHHLSCAIFVSGLASMGFVPIAHLQTPASSDVETRIRHNLGVIAHDSMGGRRAASSGARMTAKFIAAELERYGVEPAGEDGYFQVVPFVEVEMRRGTRLRLESQVQGSTSDQVVRGRNVIGVIQGSDPDVMDEIVVVGAHFDHVGVGRPVDGDSIYNGADDDASGVVAVLEVARALANGPQPRRTVILLFATAEEMGILGARYFIESSTIAMDRVVANLQVEMLARPDEAAGGTGKVWLTGDARSTMGDMFRAAGLPVVPDPRPEQRFFLRSDNIVFARAGIPAHTVSSFGIHEDYHRPSDEIERVDFGHMTVAVKVTIAAVRVLASGEKPQWNEEGRP